MYKSRNPPLHSMTLDSAEKHFMFSQANIHVIVGLVLDGDVAQTDERHSGEVAFVTRRFHC